METSGDKENQEPEPPAPAEDDETLDLENFGRKKKKKKKAFNLDELDAALPDTKKEVAKFLRSPIYFHYHCTCSIIIYIPL